MINMSVVLRSLTLNITHLILSSYFPFFFSFLPHKSFDLKEIKQRRSGRTWWRQKHIEKQFQLTISPTLSQQTNATRFPWKKKIWHLIFQWYLTAFKIFQSKTSTKKKKAKKFFFLSRSLILRKKYRTKKTPFTFFLLKWKSGNRNSVTKHCIKNKKSCINIGKTKTLLSFVWNKRHFPFTKSTKSITIKKEKKDNSKQTLDRRKKSPTNIITLPIPQKKTKNNINILTKNKKYRL